MINRWYDHMTITYPPSCIKYIHPPVLLSHVLLSHSHTTTVANIHIYTCTLSILYDYIYITKSSQLTTPRSFILPITSHSSLVIIVCLCIFLSSPLHLHFYIYIISHVIHYIACHSLHLLSNCM